jgi:hypothetical protein
MRNLNRALAALVTTGIVVGVSATSAVASGEWIYDKKNDVIQFTGDDDQTGVILDSDASLASGVDSSSMRIKHGKKSVSVLIRFRTLHLDGADIAVFFRKNGETDPYRILFNLDKKEAVVVNPHGEERCSVGIDTVTGSRGSIYAVVKRSCLSNPTKIKAQAIVSHTQGTEEAPIYDVDFISSTHFRSPQWTSWLPSS